MSKTTQEQVKEQDEVHAQALTADLDKVVQVRDNHIAQAGGAIDNNLVLMCVHINSLRAEIYNLKLRACE